MIRLKSIPLNELILIFAAVSGSIVLLSITYHFWRLGIAPTSSGSGARQLIIHSVLEQLKEDLSSNSSAYSPTIYELGSGWGGLTFAVADQVQKYPSLKSQTSLKAYELSIVPLLCSKIVLNIYQRLKHITLPTQISYGDFIEVFDKVNQGDILICYLCPQQMQRISKRLQANQDPMGVYLITLTFALPDHDAVLIKPTTNFYRDPLYFYQI
jgi:hypothetical protein